jgi:hypothetical protein
MADSGSSHFLLDDEPRPWLLEDRDTLSHNLSHLTRKGRDQGQRWEIAASFADQARPLKTRSSMYNFHGKKLENYGGGSGLTVRLLSNYRVDREKRHRFYHRRRISLLVQLRARPFTGLDEW